MKFRPDLLFLTCVMVVAPWVSPASPVTERVYLSGEGPLDAIEWEFYCTGGRRSGEWTTIKVPSNWEMEGFGGVDYGYAAVDQRSSEQGIYRTRFHAPASWQEKTVRLVFEGVMTEASVELNGKRVGAIHQGGYDSFHILLTSSGRKKMRYEEHALRFGEENELVITVSKRASNKSLEFAEREADYWIFGGIYRPVYLEILPPASIGRVAIDARANGEFTMDVFPQVHRQRNGRQPEDFVSEVTAQIETLDGDAVGAPISGSMSGGGRARVRLNTSLPNPKPWSTEFPNRYQVRVRLLREGEVLHEHLERFGFRTFELRPGDGLFLNGRRILVRGINRNGFRHDTARALDPGEEWFDARAIKTMNANTVRFHLPPSKNFLEACDALGLLVIFELTTWQGPPIDTPIARNIVYELVTRNHNHPSVALWANGNEGGFNHEIDETFALLDLQSRPVIHPWAIFGDLDTFHYPTYRQLLERLNGRHLYLPTEFLHGLYDGGLGAGLEDYWKAIQSSPRGAGGVLWCWADAAVARTDREGQLDTDGNHSADGLIGPHGEKEASYETVRELWCPVQIEADPFPVGSQGRILVRNLFHETDLEQCSFRWQTLRYPGPFENYSSAETLGAGTACSGSIPPGQTGFVDLDPREGWEQADAVAIEAIDPHGQSLMEWVWPVLPPRSLPVGPALPLELTREGAIRATIGDTAWRFSETDGRLLGVSRKGADLGLKKGPVLYAGDAEGPLSHDREWIVTVDHDDDSVRLQVQSITDDSRFLWTLHSSGLVELDYDFAPIDIPLTYCAVGFDFDETKVQAKRWLGKGPHRIWENRRAGPQFGVWRNEINDGVSGARWDLPEFRGVFAEVEWMSFDLSAGNALVLAPDPASDIGVLRPHNPPSALKANWAYPESGDLFVFHKVPAIGTKFHPSAQLGPASMPQILSGPISGRVAWLTFESPELRDAGN